MITTECTDSKLRTTESMFMAQDHSDCGDHTVYSGIGMIRQKLAQWQAIRGFRALDDQSLQDIGIERYEIRDFVLQGACCH